ncbi:hypothetical protein M3Y94_00070300 [Aphelenchoides besseyi]|nr:hypothetical protein M3Y94_00070300 [Aphelenchoides besseyi]KAI6237879.1 hypothetical protein M3Y95_00311200 [Aphelenchoides besseyi]
MASSSAEPVIQLAQKYRAEFEQTYDGLRQRSAQLSERAKQHLQQFQDQAKDLQPLAQQKKEELAKIVADMSPVEGLQTARLLDTYAWTAVLLFTYSLVSTLTTYLLAPFVGMVLDGLPSAVLAYALVPYVAYKHVQQQAGDDGTLRFKLLAFAAVEGLLIGNLFADRTLSTAGPLTFLTPLAIGIGAQLTEGKLGNSRQALLGATVGSGLALHLVFGLLSSQLSFAYFLLALAYSACGFVSLQIYLKYQLSDQNAPTHLYQFGVFCGVVAAQAVVLALFGGSHESMEQLKEKAKEKAANAKEYLGSKL